MRQHVQGAHEGGFPCPCGAKEKRPQDVQKQYENVLNVKNYGKKKPETY